MRHATRWAAGATPPAAFIAAVRTAVVLTAALLAGCAAAPLPDLTVPSYAYPVAPAVTFDLVRGEVLTPEQTTVQLARARLLFLGEHHTEPRSHAFQRELLERLAAGGRPLVVALEYLPPAADPALEDWRQGRLDELTFLERSGWYTHWGFAWAHYRDLFALIRERRLPVHGVNADRAVRDAVRAGKAEDLPPDVRALLGDLEETVPPHAAYLLDTLRGTGHAEDLRLDSPGFQRYRRVQRMWDRLMGVRTVQLAAVQSGAGSGAQGAEPLAVLLVGAGHVAFGLGANLQAARASDLPRLSVWEALVSPDELDTQGRYAVPVGMADWVRVYVREGPAPDYPSLSALRLEDPSVDPTQESPGTPPAEAARPAGAEAPLTDARGVRVVSVSHFAPRELRALRADDVVLKLNDAAPRSATALRLAYEQVPFGQAATFRVRRGDQELDVQVTPQQGGG